MPGRWRAGADVRRAETRGVAASQAIGTDVNMRRTPILLASDDENRVFPTVNTSALRHMRDL